MHPSLRVLDQSPLAEGPSSLHDLHPVLAAAPPRPRALPFVLSLGITTLLLVGLSEGLFEAPALRALQGSFDRTSPSVAILLTETMGRPGSKAWPPGGAGRDGGASGPEAPPSTLTTAAALPSEAVDPAVLSSLPTADRALLPLSPVLPQQPGGNGPGLGAGGDAPGSGTLFRPAAPDYEIVPIRRIPLYHRLRTGEAREARQPVRVRLTLGNDGVPLQVAFLSGPPFLREEALRTALQWRFDPLARHGLTAPVSTVVTFYPKFL